MTSQESNESSGDQNMVVIRNQISRSPSGASGLQVEETSAQPIWKVQRVSFASQSRSIGSGDIPNDTSKEGQAESINQLSHQMDSFLSLN